MNEFKKQNKKYLLILSCSKKKKKISNVNAIDLYNGPFYAMIKKYHSNKLDILILSAKYGLIFSTEKISYYDQKMTVKRAKELQNSTYEKLKYILEVNHYNQIFINLGKIYLIALNKCMTILNKYDVYWANGQIGERLHQLKNWLKIIREDD